MLATDPYQLKRFKQAQSGRPSYATASEEIRAGQKKGHYIWYVFPMLDGLGSSKMNNKYSIKSFAEAQAYLSDSTLGPRLVEITQSLMRHTDKSLVQILGKPDDWKFQQSMTLFAMAAWANGDQAQAALFTNALKAFNSPAAQTTLDLRAFAGDIQAHKNVFQKDFSQRGTAPALSPPPTVTPPLPSKIAYTFNAFQKLIQFFYKRANSKFTIDNPIGAGRIGRWLMGLNNYKKFKARQQVRSLKPPLPTARFSTGQATDSPSPSTKQNDPLPLKPRGYRP